jgi:hypothetical protein
MEETAKSVAVDGVRALQVGRLRWKFYGSERLDIPRCCRAARPPRLVFPPARTNTMVGDMDENAGMIMSMHHLVLPLQLVLAIAMARCS